MTPGTPNAPSPSRQCPNKAAGGARGTAQRLCTVLITDEPIVNAVLEHGTTEALST